MNIPNIKSPLNGQSSPATIALWESFYHDAIQMINISSIRALKNHENLVRVIGADSIALVDDEVANSTNSSNNKTIIAMVPAIIMEHDFDTSLDRFLMFENFKNYILTPSTSDSSLTVKDDEAQKKHSHHNKKKQVKLPAIILILDFAIQAARGLQALHEQGIVHGSVSLSNMLVRKKDFALKLYGYFSKHGNRYAAPEQQGADVTQTTKSTDTWSLAAMIFEMLGGQISTSSSYQDVNKKIRAEKQGAKNGIIGSIPSKVLELLKKCTEIDAKKRPSMDTIVQVLVTQYNKQVDKHNKKELLKKSETKRAADAMNVVLIPPYERREYGYQFNKKKNSFKIEALKRVKSLVTLRDSISKEILDLPGFEKMKAITMKIDEIISKQFTK